MLGEVPELTVRAGVVLRGWREDDAPALLEAMADPQIRQFAATLVDDQDAAVLFVGRRRGLLASRQGASWVLDAGQGLVGAVTFGLLDERLGAGSVGYWISRAARGRGLAAPALAAATARVIDLLAWHRIELYHAVENHRSCAVAVRAGYPMEGVMRQAMRYPVDGRWSDEHLHARLAGDPEPPG